MSTTPITPDAASKPLSGQHKGLADDIRRLHLKYPEMSKSDIARAVGCSPQNVSKVVESFLADTTPDQLTDFQANKADIYDAIQKRLLSSLTPEKIEKAKVMEAVTAAAILEDKARLVRGQATGINVTVLMDVAQAIRDRRRGAV